MRSEFNAPEVYIANKLFPAKYNDSWYNVDD